MAGNDKADALGLAWFGKIGRLQRKLLLKPGQLNWYWLLMTSPGPECTYRNQKNKMLIWPRRVPGARCAAPV